MKAIEPQEKMILNASITRIPKRTRKRNPAINTDNAMQKLFFISFDSLACVKIYKIVLSL